MPRHSRVPALVHHRPSGHARVRIQGRDFYLGPYGTPAAEEAYRRLIAEWLSTGQLPGREKTHVEVTRPLIVNQLILSYWRFAKGYYRKNGKVTAQLALVRGVLRTLRDHYGQLPVTQFGPLKLKALREVFIRQGLTRTGVNRRVTATRRVFKWGVAEELIGSEVFQRLSAVEGLKKGRSEAPDPPELGPVPTEDLATTLPHLGPVVRDMVELQLLSGARPGEVCELRPADLDCSGDVWEYRPATHKLEHHGKSRTIYFGQQAQAIVQKYLNRDPEQHCFSPVEAEAVRLTARTTARKTPLSFGNRAGKRASSARRRPPNTSYSVASYRRAITRACKKAGVAAWAPNRLRHTRATELRRLFGVEAARTILGHSRLSTTEIYAERDSAEARRIMGQVG